MLQLYNSLSGKKEIFKPLVDGQVKMYVCGLTVYDQAHIGHLRCMLVFDFFVKALKRLSYDVTYVRNITDVDDKIINRSNELQCEWQALTEKVISHVREQEKLLGLSHPTHEPRASAYMSQMIDLIETLQDKGYAYVADSGDVCFSVKAYQQYGQLSKQSVDELLKAHRVDDQGKRDSVDFVLWKQSKPGEPFWPSPWGDGRPGWHIECSAMALDLLGETFDLHGGGVDLKFPHHENEIAQSVCATGADFAKYWMHVGHLKVDDEKMSKSLGNFITIDEALEEYDSELLKLFLLKTHYRQPFNYTKDGVAKMQVVLLNFYLAVWPYGGGAADFASEEWGLFMDAVSDDLNTAQALAVMHQVANTLLQDKKNTLHDLAALLVEMGRVLGILHMDAAEFLQGQVNKVWVEEQIAARQNARKEKDFAAADQIRDGLLAKGICVEDTVNGCVWYNQRAGFVIKSE